MSSGKEFQRTDAATGNERRPTVDRRNGGTSSSCDDDERLPSISLLFVELSRTLLLCVTC